MAKTEKNPANKTKTDMEAPARPKGPTTAFNPADVKVAKQLVFPTLKTEPGVPIYVVPREAMFIGREMEAKEGEAKRGPATILRVHCLFGGTEDHPLNGKEVQIVANKLLVSTLKEAYPNDTYVNKAFMVTKSDKAKKGKNGDYFPFEVSEIECEIPPLPGR